MIVINYWFTDELKYSFNKQLGMPSVSRRLTVWYSMKFPALHIHNQTELGRQVLRSSFYVRVLTQVQSSLCSDYRLHLVGYLYSNRFGFPLTFTEFLAQSTNTT